MKILLLVLMIFMHLISDFTLQGILAQFKQKKYWKENYPDEKYANDWKISLFLHSLWWSISIILPPMIFMICFMGFPTEVRDCISVMLFIGIWINTAIHMFVDDLKCNKLRINLVVDQLIHMVQIIATFAECITIMNIFS